MQEEDISDDRHHEAFVCSCSKATDNPGGEERAVRVGGRLPDVGYNAYYRAYQSGRAPAKNITVGYDQ